jgi:hypothetical protein
MAYLINPFETSEIREKKVFSAKNYFDVTFNIEV